MPLPALGRDAGTGRRSLPVTATGFHVVAILEIADPNAFSEFEQEALSIMQRYGGNLVSAFRSSDNRTEIHTLVFASAAAFESYRQDPDLSALQPLRNNAIAGTVIYSGNSVSYKLHNK